MTNIDLLRKFHPYISKKYYSMKKMTCGCSALPPHCNNLTTASFINVSTGLDEWLVFDSLTTIRFSGNLKVHPVSHLFTKSQPCYTAGKIDENTLSVAQKQH